jgi:hypothetical protein
MNKRIEPTMGDYDEALKNDPAIDPPVGDFCSALGLALTQDPPVGDINACVCFDAAGNPLNQCNECPR